MSDDYYYRRHCEVLAQIAQCTCDSAESMAAIAKSIAAIEATLKNIIPARAVSATLSLRANQSTKEN
jgi:hypothetical protein